MMNNEEFERKMEFIVEQQAQFASDIQKLQESQTRTEKIVAQTSVTVAQTVDTVSQLTDVVAQTAETVGHVVEVVNRLVTVTYARFDDFNAKINALIDSHIRAEERFVQTEGRILRTEESIARTEANVARTDEALRNFIDEVKRRGQNGKKSSS